MAKVKVKYFGRLREMLGVKEEEYDVGDVTLADLILKYIPGRHREAADELNQSIFVTIEGEIAINGDRSPRPRRYFILVNGVSPKITYKVRDGDEVSILPPVGGGVEMKNIKRETK